MVDQKTHLTRDTDQMSRPKQGWLQFYMISYTQNHDCFNILYPKVNEDVDKKKKRPFCRYELNGCLNLPILSTYYHRTRTLIIAV